MTDETFPRDEAENTGGTDQAAPRDQEGATPRARRLLPKTLDFLIGERPLLWYESPEKYDALRDGVFADMVPEGAVDAIMVKDLADILWEARRLRRLKIHAIHDEMPAEAARVLGGDNHKKRDRARTLAAGAALGEEIELEEDEDEFSEQLRYRLTSAEMLHYRVLKKDGDVLERIDRRIEHLEDRFRKLLRQFEERRAGMAAMARTLMERERSRVIDVEVED